MKKIIAAAWVFALSIAVVFIVSPAEAEAQPHDQPLSILSAAQDHATPEAVARYLWRNFRFESDQRLFGQEEYWQRPEEFLAAGMGDCEDFAMLAAALLKSNQIKSYVVNVYAPRFAHTICVFEEGGRFNAIDGTDLKRLEASSLQELIAKIYPRWEKAALVAYSNTQPHQARIVKMIEKD